MSKGGILVVKVGGRVVEDSEARSTLLDLLASYKGRVVLVHGGGSLASEISRNLGFEPTMIEGRRVTGADDLRVAVMVYAGWLNKVLVAELSARGRTSIGLSGADGDLIRAHKRPITSKGIDFGYVGDVDAVNEGLLQRLFEAGLTPIVCAITHDGNGQLLNTNADTIASEVAISLAKKGEQVQLFNCLDKPGVLLDAEDDESQLSELSISQYQELKQSGAIYQGMIPKLDTGYKALEQGVEQVRLGNVKGIPSGGTLLK